MSKKITTLPSLFSCKRNRKIKIANASPKNSAAANGSCLIYIHLDRMRDDHLLYLRVEVVVQLEEAAAQALERPTVVPL